MANLLYTLEATMENILHRVCRDYKLNYIELHDKYIKMRLLSRIPEKHKKMLDTSSEGVYKNLRHSFVNMNGHAIFSGGDINKESRKIKFGNVSGGSGTMGPEKYQRQQIELHTGIPCIKTNKRLNKEDNTLFESLKNPMKFEDGYDYTENFDGVQMFGDTSVYVNMKCVCGQGGSQERTLRDETHMFVRCQLDYMLATKDASIYFANVLDGDKAKKSMVYFQNLLNKPKYIDVHNRVFVGELKDYIDWFRSLKV
jgi:hypothetical protein